MRVSENGRLLDAWVHPSNYPVSACFVSSYQDQQSTNGEGAFSVYADWCQSRRPSWRFEPKRSRQVYCNPGV